MRSCGIPAPKRLAPPFAYQRSRSPSSSTSPKEQCDAEMLKVPILAAVPSVKTPEPLLMRRRCCV